MQSTNHFLVKTGLMTHMPPVERFAVLFAAAAHDVAHPGTSNRFQIMAKSQVALCYNDRSVLENFHAATGERM